MLSRNLFIKISNNRTKPWRKKELQNICKLLNLKINLTCKELYSNIKKFYNIKNKSLLHDWKLEELKEILKKMNISTYGNKKNLYNKILQIKLQKNINSKYQKNLNNIFYTISIHQEQGKRDYMEDRIINKYNNNLCFFSVLDGHGGKDCANFLKKYLYNIFLKKYKKNKNKNIKNILINSYLYIDKKFLETNKTSGSTACSIFINNQTKNFAIANTGDSRIIALIGKKIVQLSIDHKPNNISEQRRIYSDGGFIHNSRLNGVLAMTRAIGDKNLKKRGLISFPDIILGKITNNYKYFVIASDGLYDVMTNYDIIQFIHVCLNKNIEKKNIAKHLVKYAINDKLSTDNVSVIIIFINHSITSSRTKYEY